MKGDGDGWAAGPNGSRVWGRFGAAGLLLVAKDSHCRWLVLMQHRAHWTNDGGTWALPGGARDSHETTRQAAFREAAEETGIDPSKAEFVTLKVTAGPFPPDPARPELSGGWSYTTVIARVVGAGIIETSPNEESLELRWVPVSEVEKLPLMPAFRRAWPDLHSLLIERIMTD